MFAQAFEDILADRCTPAEARAIEAGAPPAALWAAVADAGFLELLASEEDGGAGLALDEAFPLVAMLGAHAMPVPLAQAIAARALLPPRLIPPGLLTMAPAMRRDSEGRLHCPLVPYGMIAGQVLAQDEDRLYLLPAAEAACLPSGVHGSLAASMRWETAPPPLGRAEPDALAALGAAMHAALLAGAMQRVFEMSLQHANDRTQFGKSIGKFQAIQHQISVMAEHVAAATIAAQAAFQGEAKLPRMLAAAMAKSRTSEAAVLVASIAHAVHGAIGITEEFDLQLYTRRLHEWRMAHGSESHWNKVVGRALLASEHARVSDFVRAQ